MREGYLGRFLSRRLASLFLIAFLCAGYGCRRTQTDWAAQATDAQQTAEAAWRRGDAKAAAAAARRARAAVEQLRTKFRQDTNRTDLAALLTSANSAERAARTHAERAEEERQWRDLMKGWKVRTYQKARGAMLGALLPQLARAADLAATRGTGQLSFAEQKLAATALVISEWNVGGTSSSPPDWTALAARLRQWTTNEPIELRVLLGTSFVMMQQLDFALAEFQPVDLGQVHDTNVLLICHGGRALLYALRGWHHLAALEAEDFLRHKDAGRTNGLPGPQLIACLHCLLAFQAMHGGELEKRDAAIARSVQAWPDNPLVAFFTGEQLAANGEWEKAAESLEQWAKGSEEEWLARRFAERARELRDGKGSKTELFDSRFLFRASAEMAIRAAASGRTTNLLQRATALGADLLKQVPFVGEKPETP